MRLVNFRKGGRHGVGLVDPEGMLSVSFGETDDGLLKALASGPEGLRDLSLRLSKGERLPIGDVTLLPPVRHPGKILCLGLNFRKHMDEADLKPTKHPTVFARFSSCVVGSEQPLVRPILSSRFDYEGELAVVIGRGGRHIDAAEALEHVAGYSIFNDGSIRDYQLEAPQWTVGKNFQATGAFGPWLVSADSIPAGARGLRLETRLNGTVVQSASLSDMILDVAGAIALLSSAMALEPGDTIVMGTPSGVGEFRTPPLYMKPGDICEVEIEGIGVLRNPVVDEQR